MLINFSHQCERCQPLYNNKGFRTTNLITEYNCKKCNCNLHSNKCHYDVTYDEYPDDHEQGGGGVCDDCQHHTTG